MAVKKGKKKIWYGVVASKEFNNSFIGEIPSFEPGKLVGKNISTNLMTLMRLPRKQNISVKFKIKEVNDKKANTELISYGFSASHIKRLVRKARSKIDDSFILESKDKVKLRIKPIVILRNKVQRKVTSGIKVKVRELMKENIEKKTFGGFISELVDGRFQKDIRKKLSKVYPVAVFELRMVTKL